MEAAARDTWMYGDPENFDLKQALAAHHRLHARPYRRGPGIDGLLGLLCRLTLEPGTPVVTSLGAYPTFAFHVANAAAPLTRVPYRADHEDPQALLMPPGRRRARLLYLANPDNPMGSHHPPHPTGYGGKPATDTLLVLDEAYADLASPKAPSPTSPPTTPR